MTICADCGQPIHLTGRTCTDCTRPLWAHNSTADAWACFGLPADSLHIRPASVTA